VPALRDLVSAMPLIRDPGVRASLYPKVEPLLSGLPKELAPSSQRSKGTSGRFVRVEIPGKATLTLAEVEVYSDGRNTLTPGYPTAEPHVRDQGDASAAILIVPTGTTKHTKANTETARKTRKRTVPFTEQERLFRAFRADADPFSWVSWCCSTSCRRRGSAGPAADGR